MDYLSSLFGQIMAQIVNYAVIGTGVALIVTIVVAAVFQSQRLRDLAMPGRTPIDKGVKSILELLKKENKDVGDKLMLGMMFLGMCIRNGLVYAAILMLVAQLTTG